MSILSKALIFYIIGALRRYKPGRYEINGQLLGNARYAARKGDGSA